MSFITKRERVFDEYDLYDIPARNEGKLKAYASCTDARAWSHFCSDKSEHLVDIIKRNNEMCIPKYVPTEVIVNTLLANKQAEIARLKRKIDEFEQMLAAYDTLDLTSEQKREIAKAHAAIKEANKDLYELSFDLDLSGFTGAESEGDFETGKSRGDEPARYRVELYENGDEPPRFKKEQDDKSQPSQETPASKSEWSFNKEPPANESKQKFITCNVCDASTNAVDPRIQEMQENIIAKDAKINALRNTTAVMQNDVCEPYCIYAHIYTALEKIFGILCQNNKYKRYLDLMTSGKNIQCIDIKGKILFKLKVLEKFSLALLAPCSQSFGADVPHGAHQDCSCYRAEILSDVETAYALMSSETEDPSLDNKRTKLVADIMENEEMQEILNKDSNIHRSDFYDEEVNSGYNIDQENVKRLKNLQENYDDLMTCYEDLKHEKDCLQIRCQKYDELEKEFVSLQTQFREYNLLWNEKEHYRKRSLDLDSLKEQYLVLCDETTSLETELKAETEINEVKAKTIDELRSDNKALENRLNEASIAFEKERNSAQCKLKEYECKIMCQEEQIKSLSVQIDRLLDQDPSQLQPERSESANIDLIDEMNSLKEQIKNLQDALYCSEEEKQQLQEEYQNKLNFINDLKMEIEDWKSNYEKALQRNDYLEKYTDSFRDEMQKLVKENRVLTLDVDEKSKAIENLICVINNKSQEVNKLIEDVEIKNKENSGLYAEMNSLQESYNKSIIALDIEKSNMERSLKISKQESQELLEKVKEFDDKIYEQDRLFQSYQKQNEEYNDLKALLYSIEQENKTLKMNLTSREHNNSILSQEIQRLQEVADVAVNNISSLEDEKNHYLHSLELTKKDSKTLQGKLHELEDITREMEELKEGNKKLIKEQVRLENELAKKNSELDNVMQANILTKKVSEELEDKLKSTANLKEDLKYIDDINKSLIKEQQRLQSELDEKKRDFNNLLQSYNNLEIKFKNINDQSSEEVQGLSRKLASLKNAYDELLAQKAALQNDYDSKTEEINELYNSLESKIDENKDLNRQLLRLERSHETVQNSLTSLQKDNYSTKNMLETLRRESDKQMQRVVNYEKLESEYDQIKREYDQMKQEKNKLQKEFDMQQVALRKVAKDNEALNSESQHLMLHSEDLEKALISTRNELISNTSSPINLHLDTIKEVEEMKREKIANNIKIKELLMKLDESEYLISDLSEDIVTRDDKIAVLENHINELQDEVKRLHSSLAEIVDTGEQIKDNSYKKIRESLNTMEAHHSKATHNMKIEIAKLQHENVKMEERLSLSKIKSDDFSRNKHRYISQITHLQNEREIIVTDIKQLEISSVGDSALSPDHCGVEDVLHSLDRIRRCIDSRDSKTASLEETLQKIQNSYQVVQIKADEAKKIVEKEKQKILTEKEEAVKDRVNMKKHLMDLKQQLEKQKSQDSNIIKDLEAELLNQKLMFDNLNKSRQSYISKLKEEMQSVQDLYQESLERLRQMSEEKHTHLDIIENINMKFEEKCKEIDILNKDLDTLKNKPNHSLGTQCYSIHSKNEQTQTSEEFLYEGFDQYDDMHKMKLEEKNRNFDLIHTKNAVNLDRKRNQIDKSNQAKKVQVLTANIEPSIDYVRNSYLNNKLKNLSPECDEEYSVTCLSENNTELDHKDKSQTRVEDSADDTNIQNKDHKNVIDIYNKQSMHTDSSKVIDSNYPENKTDMKTPGYGNAMTSFGITTESFNTRSSQHKASNLFGPVSGISTDQDLFIIYKDGENHKSFENKLWPPNNDSEIMVETITTDSDEDNKKNIKEKHATNIITQYDIEKDSFFYIKDDELNKVDNVGHEINIDLPKVENSSPTIDTAFDGDKKSIDSFTINIYPTPKGPYSSSTDKLERVSKTKRNKQGDPARHSAYKDETQYVNSYVSTEDEVFLNNLNKRQAFDKSDRNSFSIPSGSTQVNELSNEYTSLGSTQLKKSFENVSHHRLSRTDADVHLIKSKASHPSVDGQNKADNFGLDYILATVQMDPDNIKTYNAADSLRKTRSDELFKLQRRSDSSPSRLSAKKSSTDKTMSSNNKSTSNSQSKTYTEQCVMVTLNTNEEHEEQVKQLTKKMETIEKDYKRKIEAIKMQYDSNMKNIINEHNEGVQTIQNLHEETLQDIINQHENEVENLRSMSIEAMRKADKLEKEVQSLKCRMQSVYSSTCLKEEPIKMSTHEFKKHRKLRVDTKTLTKTNVEAFNVKPKSRYNGPCTCTLDVNISDTIRNIFEQVNVEQKKLAEHTYLKFIANKIMNNTIEALDCQELSFLHLKVCRIWKVKFTQEGKMSDSVEAEPMKKQKHILQTANLANIDRKLAEEKSRLQEAREAVCRNISKTPGPELDAGNDPSTASYITDVDYQCNYYPGSSRPNVGERRSAGDLDPDADSGLRHRRKPDSNRVALAKMSAGERRERKLYNDELPTRLRRAHDRQTIKTPKK